MRLPFRIIMIAIVFTSCGTADVKREDTSEIADRAKTHVNFGYNIILAVDLSNRVKDARRYDDPALIKLITSNLKQAFQKGIDVGVNGKFLLTTINSDDFEGEKYNNEVFRIDLDRFGTRAAERSDYIHRNTKNQSLEQDLEQLNTTFTRLYQNKKNVGRWLPADMWYFFQDKLSFPILDTSVKSYVYNKTSFVNKYRNYVIILTDGYIEAGRYNDDSNMKTGNKFRYLSSDIIEKFRKDVNRNKLTIEQYFKQNNYGLMPVSNLGLRDCHVLILEMFDRSLVKGSSTKSPKDMEILKLFWTDWLVKSGVPLANFDVKSTLDNPQDVNTVVKQFLDLK